MLRVGIGNSKANIAAGNSLILGGIQIPGEYGLIGKKDGDIVCLAIIDSMLGAATLGGFDDMFPKSTPEFANMQSFELLTYTFVRLASQGYRVGNIDINLCVPFDISTYLAEIKEKITIILETPNINIKAFSDQTDVQCTAITLLEHNLLTRRNRDFTPRSAPLF